MQIQGIHAVQQVSQQQIQSSTPLKDAKQGDLISAKVTSSDSGRVTLTLDDGTKLNAGKLANEPLLPGDTVVLEVQSTSDAGTSLRLLEINSQELRAQVPELEYSLMRMNVPPDGARMAFARILQGLGLNITPQALSRMGDIVKQYPDVPGAQAALFASSDLPITEQNLADFQTFTQGPAQASEFLAHIENAIKDNPQLARLMVSPETANAVMEPANKTAGQAVNATVDASKSATANTADTIPSAPPLPEGLSAPTAQLLNASNAWERLMSDALTLNRAQPQSEKGMDTGLTSRNTPETLISGFLESLPKDTPAADKQILRETFLFAVKGEQSAGLNPQAPDAARTAIPAAAHESVPLDKLVKDMFALIAKGNEEAPEKLKDAAGGLMRRVSTLAAALDEYGGTQAKSVARAGDTIVSQLKMGGEMHNLMYAQIPYQISPDQKRSAELYVLKRDRSKRPIDDSNATVALCLETENIGRVEALVRVERNELSLQFRVENERIMDYVKSRLHGLRELDFPPQYHIRQAGVTLQKEAVTPVNAAKTMLDAFNLKNTGTLDMSI